MASHLKSLLGIVVFSVASAAAMAQNAPDLQPDHIGDEAILDPIPLAAADIQRLETESYAAAKASHEPFYTPPVIRSAGGGLSTELVARFAKLTVGGDSVDLRTYNSGLLGPTLLIEPGDLLHVRLRNDLPPSSDPLNPDHRNVTNLHTHGLQVSPEGNSDNVFLAIRPGGVFDYEFHVPSWHLPGTHWYHAHNHGSTAIQVSSGMAGALIIKGGLDDVTEIRQAQDLLFFMQQFPYDDAGLIENTLQITQWRQLQALKKRETTINGKRLPVINMKPGEVQRWRFVHAGIADELELSIKDQSDPPVFVDLHEIAADGIPLGRRRTTKRLVLGPGYRSEVLVKAPRSGGPFYLVDQKSQANLSFKRNLPKTDHALMRIELAGDLDDMPLPTDAVLARVPQPPPINAATPTATHQIKFWGGDTDRRSQINGKEFDANVTDVISHIGAVEKWTLTTDTNAPVNSPHPFHIHVNPFWAPLEDPETGTTYYAWKDTLLVRDGPGSVDIKIRFHCDVPGKTVFHCHRLDHEDHGMMGVVRIEDVLPKPTDCATSTEALTGPAPPWQLTDVAGTRRSSDEYRGQRYLLVFLKGFDCPHCLGQVALLRQNYDAFQRLGYKIALTSTEAPGDLQQAVAAYERELPFLVLSDESRAAYAAYGCTAESSGAIRHGLFVIDESDNIRWSSISDEALTDARVILEACEKAISVER